MITPDALAGTLLQRFVFNFDFVDLVLWFPSLSWSEFTTTAATVVAWKLTCDQIDRSVSRQARRLAVRVAPGLAGWAGLK